MKIKIALVTLILASVLVAPASAQTRLIVRTTGGTNPINAVCWLLNCKIQKGLDGSLNQLFLVSVPLPGGGLLSSLLNPVTVLLNAPGIVDVELDHPLQFPAQQTAPPPGNYPSGLYNRKPVDFYGATVWESYVEQPATQIIGLDTARQDYGLTGSGIVAIIDTGVDPNQPVLQSVLLPGYNFISNQSGADETQDVPQQSDPTYDAQTGQVGQSTVGVLNQSTVGVLNGGGYTAFGHGTMTAGIVHLVAPTAEILPLKAFNAQGVGNLSDVLQAIYYAVAHHANVLSMSFDFPQYSGEMARAINWAATNGVVSVASVGNDGIQTQVWPAALSNVIGVGSSNNQNQRSTFSNYGTMVWLGAPGEGIVTTYPWGAWAAGWGTSFAAPFVAGTADLVRQMDGVTTQTVAANAVSHAQASGANLGHGVLYVPAALNPWQLF
ncbi:MAG TPA: S8 family serine peptidase [Terriglobales bacterium]|nr:S8 family serine peptidase [Terriglobales bacterium]